MYNLLRKKRSQLTIAVTGIIFLCTSLSTFAQLRNSINLSNSDEKFYHIGIVLIGAQSRFQISHHPQFIGNDSITSVYPENLGGFGLGGMHTFRISDRFQIRAVFPQLIFANQALTYHLASPDATLEETSVMTQIVESIHLGLPIQLKFRSDRINNFRVYVMGGFKIETDLSSNARAKNTGDMVKLKRFDYGIEAGIGFNFYTPLVIVSPELKISNGLSNIHSRDPNVKFSGSIDKINSRMIVFSLIFEG
jgi:hypothetical protein